MSAVPILISGRRRGKFKFRNFEDGRRSTRRVKFLPANGATAV
jgi:hypothetical protein